MQKKCLKQWFSTERGFVPRRRGEAWRVLSCYDWQMGRDAAGIGWVEASDAAKHPTVRTTVP